MLRYLLRFNVMQPAASPRKGPVAGYQKVFDSRKRRMRGLWQRNGKYYANLSVADDLGRKTSKWVALAAVTLTQAIEDYRRLQVEKEENRLRPIGLKPTLADFLDTHLKDLGASGKRHSSIAKESGYLRRWAKSIGHLRLNMIRPIHLSRFLNDLVGKGYSGRSVNLYLIAIRALLKGARRNGLITPPLPFDGLEWKKVDTVARCLYSSPEIDLFHRMALITSKNGRQFADYLRFLQYSGARCNEALLVRWQDVDLERGHVTIGATGASKNRKPRVVDFNSNLETHLREMATRLQPDSQWLFPSPQRGDRDIPAKTFRESHNLTRQAAGCVCQDCNGTTSGQEAIRCIHCGSEQLDRKAKLLSPKLQKMCFHDLRHHFISFAVMSGVDFMTIAEWVGHQDGGILIGKVYGHLADEHRKRMAAQMAFGPTPIAAPPVNGRIANSLTRGPERAP